MRHVPEDVETGDVRRFHPLAQLRGAVIELQPDALHELHRRRPPQAEEHDIEFPGLLAAIVVRKLDGDPFTRSADARHIGAEQRLDLLLHDGVVEIRIVALGKPLPLEELSPAVAHRDRVVPLEVFDGLSGGVTSADDEDALAGKLPGVVEVVEDPALALRRDGDGQAVRLPEDPDAEHHHPAIVGLLALALEETTGFPDADNLFSLVEREPVRAVIPSARADELVLAQLVRKPHVADELDTDSEVVHVHRLPHGKLLDDGGHHLLLLENQHGEAAAAGFDSDREPRGPAAEDDDIPDSPVANHLRRVRRQLCHGGTSDSPVFESIAWRPWISLGRAAGRYPGCL